MKRKCETLVWIGAGYAQSLPELLVSANNLILVDASESNCKSLRHRFSERTNIKVVHALITEHGDEEEWYRYNLSDASATKLASESLKAIFPGLRLLEKTVVPSLSLQDFIANLDLSENNNALFLDCPASLQSLLNSLFSIELNNFNTLMLSLSSKPLYDGMPVQKDYENLLAKYGFEEIFRDNSDADMPIVCFSRSSYWPQFKSADAKAEHAIEELVEIREQLESLIRKTKLLEKENTRVEQVLLIKQMQLNEIHTKLQKLAREKSTIEENYASTEEQLLLEVSKLKEQLNKSNQQVIAQIDLKEILLSQRVIENSSKEKAAEHADFSDSDLLNMIDKLIVDNIELRNRLIGKLILGPRK